MSREGDERLDSETTDNDDRLSSLPDCILSDILSIHLIYCCFLRLVFEMALPLDSSLSPDHQSILEFGGKPGIFLFCCQPQLTSSKVHTSGLCFVNKNQIKCLF
ncbi:hypothetical protein SOVF_096480 [Spinacia oleracea]|nr:hypothetical protein SOVF_096480 [Spinacia oleracea]